MSAMNSGIGKAIEIIPCSGVRAEGWWALIPARVFECVVSPRGAIHGCRLGSDVGLAVLGSGCQRIHLKIKPKP